MLQPGLSPSAFDVTGPSGQRVESRRHWPFWALTAPKAPLTASPYARLVVVFMLKYRGNGQESEKGGGEEEGRRRRRRGDKEEGRKGGGEKEEGI